MSESRGAGASRGSDDLHNEDSYLVEDGLGLYIVCDGLGSEPGGEVAAFVAVEAVEHFLANVDETHALQSGAVSVGTIDHAIRYALACVLDASETRPDLEGMASTITLLLVQGDRGFIGHIGDSRAYLIRRGGCVQLTADQEWTESTGEATEWTKADRPRVETFSIGLRAGDTFILCTDGAEQEIEALHRSGSVEDLSPRLLASRLVSEAHRRDPSNDATVVAVRVREDHEFAWLELSGPPRSYAETHTVVPRRARPGGPRRSESTWAMDAERGRTDRRARAAFPRT